MRIIIGWWTLILPVYHSYTFGSTLPNIAVVARLNLKSPVLTYPFMPLIHSPEIGPNHLTLILNSYETKEKYLYT